MPTYNKEYSDLQDDDFTIIKKLKQQKLLMIDMIDALYKEGNYAEALRGLIVLKKSKMYSHDDEFDKLITPLINCCIQKLR